MTAVDSAFIQDTVRSRWQSNVFRQIKGIGSKGRPISNHLGQFFVSRRLEKSLTLGQLARMVGYRNLSKGANRIQRFERGGTIPNELLGKLMVALQIEAATAQQLAEKDRQEYLKDWEAWVSETVPIQVVMRFMPAIYSQVSLPPGVTTADEAVAFGQDVARLRRRRVFVHLSRRKTVYIDEEGKITGTEEATPEIDPRPFSQVGNEKFLFHFDQLGKRSQT
jgi:hypothetical protein